MQIAFAGVFLGRIGARIFGPKKPNFGNAEDLLINITMCTSRYSIIVICFDGRLQ
jgi:hypothetical protein